MDGTSVSEMNPQALELLSFWREARKGFVLPPRSALDPIRLKSWINNLSVVEFRADEQRYLVRLHSQFTQEQVGQDMSRRYLDDVLSPEMLPIALIPYEAARESRKPTRSIMMPQLYPQLFRKMERLVLPFSNDASPGPDAKAGRFVTWVGPIATTAPPSPKDSANPHAKDLKTAMNLIIIED